MTRRVLAPLCYYNFHALFQMASTTKVKVHLGCGKRYLPGWVHVDLEPHTHVDHIANIANLPMFDAESVDEIYACHVLEHVERRKVVSVLREWHRILKPGATLRLAVPDFDAVVRAYVNDNCRLDNLVGLLCGGQHNALDFHHMVFDFDVLETFLAYVGFDKIARYDWRDFLPQNMDDYSRAYLPHRDEKNGRLMSLNITAQKSNRVLTDTQRATITQRMTTICKCATTALGATV